MTGMRTDETGARMRRIEESLDRMRAESAEHDRRLARLRGERHLRAVADDERAPVVDDAAARLAATIEDLRNTRLQLEAIRAARIAAREVTDRIVRRADELAGGQGRPTLRLVVDDGVPAG